MATSVLGLKTFAASDPVDYNEINDNYTKIDNGVKTAMQGRAAHNLLDNSDFTNAINQRGATTATIGKYFIDRWTTEPFPSGPSITIDSNGLTLLPTTSSTAGIYQQLPDYENRKGKVHTLAVCVGNVWKCVSFTMGNFGVGYEIHGLNFFSTSNRNVLLRNNVSNNPASITIQRIALYEGSYTADTLPAYVPKGYAAELAVCQRQYFPVFQSETTYAYWTKADGDTCKIYIPSPKMRVNPTPVLYDGGCTVYLAGNSTWSNAVTLQYYGYAQGCNVFSFASPSAYFESGKTYLYRGIKALSAEM